MRGVALLSYWQEFKKGIFKDNPTFGLVLGICPVLAVTTAVVNGVAMGIAASVVLVCSNILISILRKLIPDEIRIPCYIVVIAAFVTMVELLMKGLLPAALNEALGIFIPLIVVNCIILGRAEAFANRNTVFRSILDALGMGVGFTVNLILVSSLREVIGAGTLLGYPVSRSYVPASIAIMAPGAFLVLGLLLGFFNFVRMRRTTR